MRWFNAAKRYSRPEPVDIGHNEKLTFSFSPGKKLSFSLCLELRLASFSHDGYIDTFLLNEEVERLAKSEYSYA